MTTPYAFENAEQWMAIAVETLEKAALDRVLSEREAESLVGLVEIIAYFQEMLASPEGEKLLGICKKVAIRAKQARQARGAVLRTEE